MFDLKYRPKRFSEVVGQDGAVKQLIGMVKQKKVPRALLFGGPYGCGKTTLARIFARAINCKNLQDGEPCLKCDACKDPKPDIVEVNVADERGIDTMRDLVKSTIYKPFYNYKVYILDEFHQATNHAQQALLKPLEEPNANVVWIICTTDPNQVMDTIRSRCRLIKLSLLEEKSLIKVLKRVAKKEKLNLPKGTLKLIAEYAGGHTRDALQILEAVADALKAGGKLTAKDIEKVVDATVASSERQAAQKWMLAFLNDSVSGMFLTLKEVDRADTWFLWLGEVYEQTLAYYLCKDLIKPGYKGFHKALGKIKKPKKEKLTKLGGILGEHLSLAKRYAMDPKICAMAFTAQASGLINSKV